MSKKKTSVAAKIHVSLTEDQRARLEVKAGGRPLASTALYLIEFALDTLGIQAYDSENMPLGKVGGVAPPRPSREELSTLNLPSVKYD